MGSSTKNIALILCGSGVYDGTEITEGVSALIHLSRAGATVKMFAPDKPQMHTINHKEGMEDPSSQRNCLVEAARLARGNIQSLDECCVKDFDALVIPGGFGVAKNLCDFAVKGPNMTVEPSVAELIKEFSTQKKVIGLCCIAPVLAANLIPGVRVTVGNDTKSEMFPNAEAAGAIEAMGGVHVNSAYDKAVVDEEKRVVTSAAYMYAGKPHEIDDSVKSMISTVLALVEKAK